MGINLVIYEDPKKKGYYKVIKRREALRLGIVPIYPLSPFEVTEKEKKDRVMLQRKRGK